MAGFQHSLSLVVLASGELGGGKKARCVILSYRRQFW